jgi:hypothetical protein
MSGPKGCELRLVQQEQERLAKERSFHTASNRYQRCMDDWGALKDKCSNLELPKLKNSHHTHEQLLSQLEQLRVSGNIDEALLSWNNNSIVLERAITEAKSLVAERVLEIANRNRAYAREVKNYHQRFHKVVRHLESLIPQDLEDEIRSPILQKIAALKTECAPSDDGGIQGSPLKMSVLDRNEAALHSKSENLIAGVQDIERNLENIHADQVTAKMLSDAAPTQKIEDFLASIEAPIVPDAIDGKLNELLRDIIALENSIDWRAIVEQAERIRDEGDSIHRENLYTDLVIRCSGRLKDLKTISIWREKLLKLIDRASSIPSDTKLLEFRKQLELTFKKDLPVDLAPFQKDLDALLDEAIARQEQEKKRRAVIESLAELGYEITSGMGVAEVKGGSLEFRKPDEDEYAISVTIDNKAEILETEMIRYSETQDMTRQQAQRDIEMEESWCADHAKAIKSLKSKGVDTGFLYKKRPGEHPVSVKTIQSNKVHKGAKVHESNVLKIKA